MVEISALPCAEWAKVAVEHREDDRFEQRRVSGIEGTVDEDAAIVLALRDRHCLRRFSAKNCLTAAEMAAAFGPGSTFGRGRVGHLRSVLDGLFLRRGLRLRFRFRHAAIIAAAIPPESC